MGRVLGTLSSSAWALPCHAAHHRVGALGRPAYLPQPKEIHCCLLGWFSCQPRGTQGRSPRVWGVPAAGAQSGRRCGHPAFLPAWRLSCRSYLFAGMVITSLMGRFTFLTGQHAGILPVVPPLANISRQPGDSCPRISVSSSSQVLGLMWALYTRCMGLGLKDMWGLVRVCGCQVGAWGPQRG